MNGVLAGIPNNNRSVEVEVANRFVRDTSLAMSDIPIPNMLDIPNTLKKFASPSDDDDDFHAYPKTFWVLTLLSGAHDQDRDRFDIQRDLDRGYVENWPVKFKSPKKVHIRCKPELLRELNFFFGDLYENNLDYIQPRINKFGRCEVNGQKFSSDFNSTDRGSIVKVMFVDRNGELTPYFGIVRFYFSVAIVVQQKPVTHYLAYVTWLKFKWSSPDPVSHLHGMSKDLY